MTRTQYLVRLSPALLFGALAFFLMAADTAADPETTATGRKGDGGIEKGTRKGDGGINFCTACPEINQRNRGAGHGFPAALS